MLPCLEAVFREPPVPAPIVGFDSEVGVSWRLEPCLTRRSSRTAARSMRSGGESGFTASGWSARPMRRRRPVAGNPRRLGAGLGAVRHGRGARHDQPGREATGRAETARAERGRDGGRAPGAARAAPVARAGGQAGARGGRRRAARLGVVLGLVALFPVYLGAQSLVSQSQLVPHLVYLVTWAVSAALIALRRGGRPLPPFRSAARRAVRRGLSAVTFGLFLADLGEAVSGGASRRWPV